MPVIAPELPTTIQLEAWYAMDFDNGAVARVAKARQAVGAIANGDTADYLAIIGPCALTDTAHLNQEGDALLAITQAEDGIYALHRLSPWKPRSRADAWHGLETTDPGAAYRLVAKRAIVAANVSMEFGHDYHAERYGRLATMGWIGGRHVENGDLIRHIALHEATIDMPLAIKNGLDGNINQALEQITMARRLRGDSGAPVVLLYRGGDNARTPEAWERYYLEALDRTEGRLIVDKAHGSEMAHDPTGQFDKSVDGQLLSQAHYLELAARGLAATGSMYEASSAKSPVDPVMPFAIALSDARHAAALRTNRLVMAS